MEPGYKQTEIGIIPEDWTVRKIGELAKIRMCKRIFAGQTTETGDIPFFKIGTFGGIPDAYISRGIYDEYKAKYSFPSKGDILISAAGTLGRTAVYDGKDAYFQDSNIVWLDIDKKEICNEYLQHYYKIIVWASSEGSTIARLYNGIIESTYIAYPPIPEQERIAETLSDVDALIASLEKLIAKKKAIKQGAMQRLLTGKTRLPGFEGKLKKTELGEIPEDWEVTQLGRLCSITTGRKDVNEGNPNGIYPFFTCSRTLTYSDRYSFACEAILIAGNGEVGNLHYYNGKFEAYQRTYVLSRFEISAYYIFYFLEYKLKDELGIGKIGSSIPYIKKENLRDFILFLPDVKEQQAIVDALSDINSEIEQLEQKIVKTRQLKQGMMQQLLTGKIRLT